MTSDRRSLISARYHTVTKVINREFWDSKSDTSNSLYVGSYDRRTAVSTSDIDILVSLPKEKYEQYDFYWSNGQSKLLQAVKNVVQNPYPRSQISADGQVIKIDFSDDMKFEILLAFADKDI